MPFSRVFVSKVTAYPFSAIQGLILLLDRYLWDMSILKARYYLQMPHILPNNRHKITEVAFKFWMPHQLYRELQAISRTRMISLSALIRVVLSQYIQSNKR